MISIILTTYDDEQCINTVLEALAWCEDIVVIDRDSTDHTVEIAKTFPNVSIGGEPKHDWVLQLSGCEILTEQLAKELQELEPNIEFAYAVPIQTIFLDKRMHYGGWGSRREVRLTHRKHLHTHNTRQLQHSIERHPFVSTEEMLSRLQKTGRSYKGTHSWWKLLIAPTLTCIKAYFFQLGFLDGTQGYLLAKYKSHQAFYNQLFAREAKLDKPPVEEEPISDEA